MGNNMVSLKVTVKGTRPLLWHAFGPDSLPLEKQESRDNILGFPANPYHTLPNYTEPHPIPRCLAVPNPTVPHCQVV